MLGVGCVGVSPLAQGTLTDKYLNGIPDGSRATQEYSLFPSMLGEETIAKVRSLSEIAERRDQKLAQMAIAWTLRHPVVTDAV